MYHTPEPVDFNEAIDSPLDRAEAAYLLAPACIDAYDFSDVTDEQELPIPPVCLDELDATRESILTNSWLARCYAQQGPDAAPLARECAAASFAEWRLFHDLLPADVRREVVTVAVQLHVTGAHPCLLLN